MHLGPKNLLVWNHVALSLDILYVASPRGPLPRLFKLCPWGKKWARHRGHMFCIDVYRENMKTIFLSEPTRPRALIFGMKHHQVDPYQVVQIMHLGPKNLLVWNHEAFSLDILSVASPRWPLPRLFKLCPWGKKWARHRGHMFCIDVYRENMKKSSFLNPQGTEPWYLVWSIIKWTPTKLFKLCTWGQKTFLSETTRHWALIFCL